MTTFDYLITQWLVDWSLGVVGLSNRVRRSRNWRSKSRLFQDFIFASRSKQPFPEVSSKSTPEWMPTLCTTLLYNIVHTVLHTLRSSFWLVISVNSRMVLTVWKFCYLGKFQVTFGGLYVISSISLIILVNSSMRYNRSFVTYGIFTLAFWGFLKKTARPQNV